MSEQSRQADRIFFLSIVNEPLPFRNTDSDPDRFAALSQDLLPQSEIIAARQPKRSVDFALSLLLRPRCERVVHVEHVIGWAASCSETVLTQAWETSIRHAANDDPDGRTSGS